MNQQQIFQRARESRDARFDGKFFVAVKSTGIFCRPICPAKLADEDNVEYFAVAPQALQAGYRPCLRCRPDSAPKSFAWKGVDTTVDRALTLMRQSPEQTLLQLCERLGISPRYLRALFNKKVGMSPKQYQLYEQLLLAKQLLHQSQLTVEHVAQICGFSSARRLQENMQKQLSLSPSQIRSRDSGDADGITCKLYFRPPYHWPQVRDFLAVRAIEGMEHVTTNGYARTIRYEQVEGWFNAKFDEKDNCFAVTIKINDLTAVKPVIDQIRRILDLEADPQIISQHMQGTGLEPTLCLSGIRIPGIWSTFEAGCRAVLGQQISVKAAIALVTQLVDELGETSCHGKLFPTPQSVAQSDLTFLRIPDSRRQTLRRLAEYHQTHQNSDNPSDWLPIKGIGPWTVAYAQMRGLSDPDIWLNTDLVIKKQLQRHSLDAEQAKPWRSYLTFQLWSMV